MEAIKRRHIKSGEAFEKLFPLPGNHDLTIRRNANLDDTVAFIPKVVRDTLFQTEGIAKKLKGSNVYDTCRNIWRFVYEHINYRKDKEGYEQIRSPSRSWKDRREGVDCDCYSVFISSILTNLGVPHVLRITKYAHDYFQHIYPIVPNGSRMIILDCVTDRFDYEVPYTQKKDFPMDLQYLDGFDEITLGVFSKKKNKPLFTAGKKRAAHRGAATTATPKKKKGFFKKVLHAVNKVNPATILLRNGILTAMKLNIKNVAGRLRWSYLSPDKIAQHGIDPAKFQRLTATRHKLENIFSGAGGKIDNLRKAILGGKGNKDKAVSGLGMLLMQEWNGYMNEHTPLEQLLGADVYYSENIEGMEGFQGLEGLGALGEPITLASVGAAMGVLAGIVAALKQIGSIFKKDAPAAVSKDFNEEATDAPENNIDTAAAIAAAAAAAAKAGITPATDTTTTNDNNNNADHAGANSSYNNNGTDTSSSSANAAMVKTNTGTVKTNNNPVDDNDTKDNDTSDTATGSKTGAKDGTDNNDNPDKKEGFWDKNKKWIKPVAIGAGGLVLIAIGVSLVKGHNKTPAPAPSKPHGLSGAPNHHHHKRKKSKKHHKKKHTKKHAVSLL